MIVFKKEDGGGGGICWHLAGDDAFLLSLFSFALFSILQGRLFVVSIMRDSEGEEGGPTGGEGGLG